MLRKLAVILAAIALPLALAAPAGAAAASPQAPQVITGYTLIDDSGQGYYLQANGHNNRVITGSTLSTLSKWDLTCTFDCSTGGWWQFADEHDGLCLNVPSDGYLYTDTCNGSSVEAFAFRCNGSICYLENLHYALYVSAVSISSGSQVNLRGFRSGWANQLWYST